MLEGPLIRLTHAWDKASTGPVMAIMCRVVPRLSVRSAEDLEIHIFISNLLPLRSDTAVDSEPLLSPVRLEVCVWMLTGGTAADILVHFPAIVG